MEKVRAVALEFEGKTYRTIGDITKRYKTSEKKIKSLVANGDLPSWKEEMHGTRKFRYFDDEWLAAADIFFENLRGS